MSIEIKVPSLGESESEAVLERWLVQPGDTVAVDDVLAEIESDKVTMEITAFEAGVIREIRQAAGATVKPGEVIGIMEAGAVEQPVATAKATEKTTVKEAHPETGEVKAAIADTAPATTGASDHEIVASSVNDDGRREERQPMSALRRRIASRLKSAQNTAAILTTFNEVNMQAVFDLRQRYQDAFVDRHGIKLGMMSFFVRACAHAMQQFPLLNAAIDGDDIVYHNYLDVGIAVSTDKGLMVPVLRDAGLMSFADIEQGIAELARRARQGKLTPDDLAGGTFSITNGGVFGSMLSTPILNPPQSAILGMHSIQQRPVAENGQVVIRPMMYLALSYDHRLIDGREAVQFLSAVKAYIEQPGVALLEL